MADPYAYNDPPSEEEEDWDDDEEKPSFVGGATVHSHFSQNEAHAYEEDEEVDEDDEAEEQESVVVPVTAPRGKPEALSASIMAAHMTNGQVDDDEDEEEEEDDEIKEYCSAGREDDESEEGDAVAVEEPIEATTPTSGMLTTRAPSTKDSLDGRKATVSQPQRKKAGSKPNSTRPSNNNRKSAVSKQKKKPLKKSESPEVENLIAEQTERITPEEYEQLGNLMVQFCRVPLLAEFSRPVKLLHPELAANYSKIVTHPVDLGLVCRGIRRREYKSTRDVRLDMWCVFANCVKFHSHPSNKEKVPSFVSIALHLREYFNSLWQEYMLPSELPPNSPPLLQDAFAKRARDRQRRLDNSGVLMMSKKFLGRVSRLIGHFIEEGGRVDVLDEEELFGAMVGDVEEVNRNLRSLQQELLEMSGRQEEYSIDDFTCRLQNCYTKDDVLEDNPALRNRFRNRLDRLIGKLTVPLHEANSRGVTQSSIWGNIATTIWARESGKKPYWPALCLGILPPEDQREGWHAAVTERNEARLPEKLRAQLMATKKKCEAAQKRQPLSYFLVEFLGTHEFIWVRETDIVEKFDPAQDPNKAASTKGKKRASRSAISSVIGSKTYGTALEECEWATDEFEQVLQEAFDYESDKETTEDSGDDDEGEFTNYSYNILNQSDEEAEAENLHKYTYDEDHMSMDDLEEANWLLAHEGKVDTSTDARKQAKKRAQALKKRVEEKEKKDAAMQNQKKEKKKQIDAKVKEREALKEIKELERRRKKRSREREKALKTDTKKIKGKRRLTGPPVSDEENERGLGHENKRARATAIVRAFINRMAQKEEYQGLHLGGTSAIPASTVEASALMSMALAFRVAAGELRDNTESVPGEEPINHRPWESIDTEGPKTHQERSAKLKEKVKLLEEEIERVRANTQRRKELLFMAVSQRQQEDLQIQADDQLARINHFKKKKKALSLSASRKTGTSVDEENESQVTGARAHQMAKPARSLSSVPSMASGTGVSNNDSGSELRADDDEEDVTDDEDGTSVVASTSMRSATEESCSADDQSTGDPFVDTHLENAEMDD